MPTTDNMSLVLPTEDGSSDTWDTLLNAAFELIDSHDHSGGKGVPVPTAGIEIDANLPFGGFAATGLKAATFNAIATSAMSGLTCALFRNSADNELYWRTSTGVNVKVTDGTGLNSTLLGGFTGDYGLGDEEAEYTSSSAIYDFRSAATTRAKIDCSDIRLYEHGSGITNAVKLKSPAGLAASYSLEMPGALPSATKLLKSTTAGVLGYTGTATHDGNLTQAGTLTVTGAATLSSSLGVTGSTTLSGTLAVTGASTLSSTLGVTGLITATAGLTAAANQHVTVTGTGKFKHGTAQRQINLTVGKQTSGSNCSLSTSTGVLNGGIEFSSPLAGNRYSVVFPMTVGERLQSVLILMNENLSGGNGKVDFRLYKAGALVAGASASSAGSGVQTVTLTPSSPAAVTTALDEVYVLDIEVDGNTGIVEIEGAAVTFDVP